jgi:hypothetical protein
MRQLRNRIFSAEGIYIRIRQLVTFVSFNFCQQAIRIYCIGMFRVIRQLIICIAVDVDRTCAMLCMLPGSDRSGRRLQGSSRFSNISLYHRTHFIFPLSLSNGRSVGLTFLEAKWIESLLQVPLNTNSPGLLMM